MKSHTALFSKQIFHTLSLFDQIHCRTAEHTPTNLGNHAYINFLTHPLIMDDSQVDEFCLVTGTSRERAEFFLQAAAGNLQAAIDAFYGEEGKEVND